MNKYLKKIKPKSKYREFLKVLNGNLHLTDRELDVMSLLLKLDREWEPFEGHGVKNIVSTANRKYIMRETRITKNNLTKYIRDLRNRGLLYTNSEGGTEVSPMFLPKETGNIIEVVFTLDFGN